MQELSERCDAVLWKIANRVSVACAGKIFCGNPGKNFRRNCFWENLGGGESVKLTQSVGMINGQMENIS